jgi:hypothetical protein
MQDEYTNNDKSLFKAHVKDDEMVAFMAEVKKVDPDGSRLLSEAYSDGSFVVYLTLTQDEVMILRRECGRLATPIFIIFQRQI